MEWPAHSEAGNSIKMPPLRAFSIRVWQICCLAAIDMAVDFCINHFCKLSATTNNNKSQPKKPNRKKKEIEEKRMGRRKKIGKQSPTQRHNKWWECKTPTRPFNPLCKWARGRVQNLWPPRFAFGLGSTTATTARQFL